jgi:hypothetical protein
MNERYCCWWPAVLLACALAASCDDQTTPPGVDAGPDAGYGEYDAVGVDILLVVDNSMSMGEEQEILGIDLWAFVEELTANVDSVRVGVVSSDMGLSWADNPYMEDDGWPGELPSACGAMGDFGVLQTYDTGKTIELAEGSYDCPELNASWAQTPLDGEPNSDLPGQAACLVNLGTDGCGWEQPLQSAAKAVHRSDQEDFTREDHLLAVIVVSDEDDCSIESNELFAENEIQHPEDGYLAVACGNHPQHLYEAASYLEVYANPKDENPNGVVFAAIVGVPPGEACEGRGAALGNCLDHPDMVLDVVMEGETFFFKPACDRYDGDVQVTKARPGRRFVELAVAFGENGYVYSICNADLGPGLGGIAQMIRDELND